MHTPFFSRLRTYSLLPALAGVLWLSLSAACQQYGLPDAPQPDRPAGDAATLRNTPRNLLKDQEAIWSSPARLNDSNAFGPIVLALATTVLVTTDHQVMSTHFQDQSLSNHAVTASNGLVGAFVGVPALLFGVGEVRHDGHASETGILGGEAMLDSLAVNEAMKAATMRERPTLDDARGKFFQTSVGFDSSFPSNHAIVAWSSAAVLASEYPGPLTEITAYGLATGVSVARVVGRQHFPSDVLVGSAVGWMIGRYVYHRHHHDDGGYGSEHALLRIAKAIE